MKKPLRSLKKRFLRFSSKPLLTLIILLIYFGINAQSWSIVNSCVCLSNSSCPTDGQFTSTLRITGGGTGPWYIVQDSVSGFYDMASPAPPGQPLNFVTGAGVGAVSFTNIGGGVFELQGKHIDSKPFRVLATDGVTNLAITSSGCSYPHTLIQGDPYVCEGRDTTYFTVNHTGSSYTWTLDHGGTFLTPTNLNSIRVRWNNNSNGQIHHLTVNEVSSLGCTQTKVLNIEIEDTITMACNNNVQISLDANCAGELTADMFLEGTRYEDASYSLKVQDAQGHVITPLVLSNSMVGKTYTVTVTHLCSGNSCWSKMLVLDKTAPELECGSDTIKCSDSVNPLDLDHGFPLKYYTSILPTSNPYVFTAKRANGCSDVKLQYYDDVKAQACSSPFAAKIIRTWFAIDNSGNFSSCIDTIWTTRTGLADISYPKNWDGMGGNPGPIPACSTYPKDNNGNPAPSKTGQPEGPFCGNIMVSYTDKRLFICKPDQASYKVLRHWLVMDNCTGKSFDTIQIISVMDNTNPVVTIPGLNAGVLTINTTNYNCGADAELPVPVVSDCSATSYKVKYQVADANGNFPDPTIPYLSVPFVGGKYKIPNIPTGLARAKYIVEDACGNTTEKIITIKIVDNLPPQAICDAHTSITLNENGLGYLSKLTFDDGSYDNCTPVKFRVRRTSSTCNPADLQWGEGINFCCADVGPNPVMVELEVTDGNGLKNTCMAQVIVSDKEAPKIIKCPTSGEVSCKFDYSNLSVFGTLRANKADVLKNYIIDPENGGYRYFGEDGYATDNCNLTIEVGTPSITINNCGVGTIIRSFKAKDSQGNYSTTCYQTILVKDLKPFNPVTDIDWPDDYTSNGCLGDAILPDNLPAQYGWPKLLGEDRCSMVAMDYSDLVFEHIDGMCYKILRKWRVVDWCQYNQNDPINSPGYWEYGQNLIVNDDVNPTITSGCQPKSIVATGLCKYRVTFEASGTDNCTLPEHLAWSYKLQKNDSPTDFIVGNTKEISVELGKGTHRITWFATDHCGNVGTCSQTFVVRDDKKPTPQCIEGLVTVLLPSTGQVTINASSFNVHSFDDCTLSNYGNCGCLTDLKFSFSQNTSDKTRTLTCANIADGKKDTIELQMWVTDESGNQDYCNTFIVLQDNSNVCPDFIPAHDTVFYHLNGFAKKPNDQAVDNVKLMLTDESNENSRSIFSDSDGKYSFSNLADNLNYHLQAGKEGDDINGLSTLDIVLIQKHLLNIKKLDSPYKMIAADVNNSGNISASDILELRKLVLGENNKFKSNISWKFVDKDIDLSRISDYREISDKIQIGNQTENVEKNYVAIKIGDVNYSAKTSGSAALVNRNEVNVLSPDIEFKQGENVELQLKPGREMTTSGMQFTLFFDVDKLVYKNFESKYFVINSSNVNLTNLKKGIITFSIDDLSGKEIPANDYIMNINFSTIANGVLSHSVKMNSELTKAEIYEGTGDNILESDLKLRFSNQKSDLTFEVYQNTPNPFSDKTNIGFVLPEPGITVLTVFDLNGKVVYTTSKDCNEGYNEFELSNKELESTGMLYYKLESGEYSEMKKMILIR